MAVSTSVVSLSIVLGTRGANAAPFGTPAIFGKCPVAMGGGRLYELSQEGLASMVTDGFTVLDRVYKLASSMAAQSPHADNVMIFPRAALTTSVLDWTPLNTTEGTIYSFDLTYKGITSTISYTVGASSSVNAICDAVEILIDASLAGIAGATVAPDNATATKLTFTGGTPGEPVMISGNNPALAKILDTSTNAGIATDLAAAATFCTVNNKSFYRFVIDSFSEAENNAAAAWAEANGQRFYAHSADSTNVVDSAGSGVGADFFTAGYNRASVHHNGDMKGNEAACYVSQAAASNPGEFGAAYKTFSGPAADGLTAGQLSNADGKNINVYALDNGQSHTFFGKAASGRALRVQDALDVIDARIREAILSVFLSNVYVPMSDEGFAQQQAAVLGVLASFEKKNRAGFIEPGSITVTVPKKSTVSASNLTAGLLTPLRFGCVIPNDMIRVVVQGVVSL